MSRDVDQRTRRSGRPDVRIASYSELPCAESHLTCHQPRLNGRVAGPDGRVAGPEGAGRLDGRVLLEDHVRIDRMIVMLVLCFGCCCYGQMGMNTEAISASVSSVSMETSSR